jgi:hypothetical protein
LDRRQFTSIRSRSVSINNIEDLKIRHRAVLPRCATAKFLLQLMAGVRGESADRVCRNLAGRPPVLIRGGAPRRVLGDRHVLRVAIAVHESELVICWHVVAVENRVVRRLEADGRVHGDGVGGLFAPL